MRVAMIVSSLWRSLVIAHRYLGIAVGLLMLAWFVSGIVMMYVGFPQPAGSERLRDLPTIAWGECCRVDIEGLRDDQPVARAEIEMLLGAPVLRLPRVLVPVQAIDLTRGNEKRLNLDEAKIVAMAAVSSAHGSGRWIAAAEEIEEDQWILNRYRQEQPIFRVAFDDAEGSVFYVSGVSGRIVLRTTRALRFWNWLGAIPHWLYFEALRTDGLLWTKTVIWTSILGSFLTIVGLILGIAQFRPAAGRRISPYRGLFYWHHLAGLVFGVVTLAFVASGLVSMNPWGFLDSRGRAVEERTRLEGQPQRWSDVKASILALRRHNIAAVNLSLAPYGSKLFWLATDAGGTVARLDSSGNRAPLGEQDLSDAAARLAGPSAIATQGLISEGDSYYLGEAPFARGTGGLPVYRIIADDAENTRYYLSPSTGALVQRLDANRRWHRWLFSAVHRLDFAPWIRLRPVWDVVLIALMLGGVAVSATGVYLAIRRIRYDVVMLLRFFSRCASRLNGVPKFSRAGTVISNSE